MVDFDLLVLGAGVIGLTSAIELKRTFRNANVTILAEKFNQDTTSHVAAGIFRPGTSFAGPSDEISRKWITDSYQYWNTLRNSLEGSKAGLTQVSGYIFSSNSPSIVRNSYIEDLVPIYRPATREELQLCGGNWKYGSFFTTLLTDCSKYLPWALKEFENIGGRVIHQKIESFSDLPQKFDIVINCTGLGAKWLCNDNRLVPIRGQVLKVKAPWIKMFFYGDYDNYIIPGFDSVTLGGCRQYDSYNLHVNKYNAQEIRENCMRLVSSLKGAEFVGHRVGLRPHRDPVRVEKEVQNINGKKVRIVHNYGHGGYGVTTAPGTALHAVKLVGELIMGNSKL